MNAPNRAFTTEAVDSDLDEPQKMPVTAWLSLFIALIGSCSIGSAPMAVLPAVAIGFALIALRPRNGVKIIGLGRGIAVVGLLLGLLFVTASLSEDWLRKNYLIKTGEKYALDWLTVLGTGEIEYATELCNSRGGRQIVGADLKAHYSKLEDEARQTYEKVKNHAANPNTLLSEQKPSWKLVGPNKVTRNYTVHRIELKFEDQNNVVKAPLTVAMKREFDEFTRNNEWWIEME